jgi:hypothetical protein
MPACQALPVPLWNATSVSCTNTLSRTSNRHSNCRKKNDWVSAWLAGAEAARLAPNWERVQLFQRQLLRRYPFLIVAVPQLPHTTWPPLAMTLSDQMAVSLLYEWLIEPRQPPLTSAGYWSSPGFAPFRQRGSWFFNWPSYPLLFATSSGERLARWQDVQFSLHCAGDPQLLLYEPLWDKRWSTWHTVELSTGQWQVQMPLSWGDPMRLFYLPLLPATDENSSHPGDSGKQLPAPFVAGTGPYVLAERSDNQWVFRARPGWVRPHAQEGPLLREIRFRRYADVRQAHEDLECGAVHLVVGLTARDADTFANIPHARIVCLPRQEVAPGGIAFSPRVAMLAFHRRRPTVQSALLRQAISVALDRQNALTNPLPRSRSHHVSPHGRPGTTGQLGLPSRLFPDTAFALSSRNCPRAFPASCRAGYGQARYFRSKTVFDPAHAFPLVSSRGSRSAFRSPGHSQSACRLRIEAGTSSRNRSGNPRRWGKLLTRLTTCCSGLPNTLPKA